jgi:hypothetical protein
MSHTRIRGSLIKQSLPEITLTSPLASAEEVYQLTGVVRGEDGILMDGWSVRIQALLTAFVDETFLGLDGAFGHALELAPSQDNPLILTVCDSLGDEVRSIPIVIRHLASDQAHTSSAHSLRLLDRAILIEVLDGARQRVKHVVAPLGSILPGTFTFACRTIDRCGRILVPIHVENDVSYPMTLENLDRQLPIGSVVNLTLRMTTSEVIEVEIGVPGTGQRKQVVLDVAELRRPRDRASATERLEPAWALFARLVKHCLIEAGRLADQSGRDRAELFEQVYAQERYAEQAYAEKDQHRYRECHENLGKFASYLDQLQRGPHSSSRVDQQSALISEFGFRGADDGMLEGITEVR